MRWSEVTMLRSARSTVKTLAETLKNLMADVARSAGNKDIRVFLRENTPTDICVVLFHSGKKTRTGESSLGLRIVGAFKEIGLVHHTIWNEVNR